MEEAVEAAKRIVAWDEAGRLADDEWLVERNESAIIAIARALLSSSERVKRTFKVWAIMSGRNPVGIGYLGSTRDDVKAYECQPGERVVPATLTLSPPRRKK